MKADLSRRTFDPLKHFTRVLMQQGRVQLDADWNEQTAILLHYLRALAADLIGRHGGPADNLGFAISSLATGRAASSTPVPNDFIIGYGHYYVDGILCEADSKPIPITGFFDQDPKTVKVLYWPQDDLEFRPGDYAGVSDGAAGVPMQALIKGPPDTTNPVGRTLTLDKDVSTFKNLSQPRVRHLITYLTQPDYPIPDADKKQLSAGTYQVYLDVWERLVTYVEDDSIREVALDGPDTAARAKVVWQVKALPLPADDIKCLTVPELNDLFQKENRGWLKAMAKQTSTSTDPCIISPEASYRGAENQLYRVEIHQGGTIGDKATFKWSRENGSAIYAIVSGGGTATVTLENLGRGDRFGLAEGDWVEVVDDDYVLQNRPKNLLQVQLIDRADMKVTLTGTPDPNVGQYPAKHPLLRRWDHKAGDDPAEGGLTLGSDNAALIVEDSGSNWLELEDGIRIQFQKPDKGAKELQNTYRTGDYWLIPARSATGDVEWPREKGSDGNLVPIAKPPDGITHHYAPLAVIAVGQNGAIDLKLPCQKTFMPSDNPVPP